MSREFRHDFNVTGHAASLKDLSSLMGQLDLIDGDAKCTKWVERMRRTSKATRPRSVARRRAVAQDRDRQARTEAPPGVGAIRELAITMTAGPAPLVARANRAEVDRAWLALSGAYARGARQGDEHVYVSSHDLAVLLTVIASTVELL
jgi:hypothetical protein